MIFPNFLIIGANKGGTSSLYSYLQQHPEIFMSRVKEPNFFVNWDEERDGAGTKPDPKEPNWKDWRPISSLAEYREMFQVPAGMKAAGEASTAYLANKECAAKIFRYNPDMRIIAILRDPVSRAFSNYLMYVRLGHEDKEFSVAVEEELSGKRGYLPQGRHYLSLGFYHESVSEFIRVFGKERVRVYLTEELKHHPAELFADAFGFLGVDPSFVPDTSRKSNVNNKVTFHSPTKRLLVRLAYNSIVRKCIPRSWVKPSGEEIRLDDSIRRRLRDLYREDTLKLQDLTGKNLSAWLE